MTTGRYGSFSFSTKAPDGFSPDDLAFLRAIFPAAAACQEILATGRVLREVMRMYVGGEPHRRILSGDVHRGEVMQIRSAILFADMRRFTELTAEMEAEAATGMLNAYYDCVVPPVEARGGEVLKFIGDGVLAAFRAGEDERRACDDAIAAALDALDAVASRTESPEFEIGIAVHFGEVAFGNVGSGARLDYTIIGRDVNVASRIASLCGTLGEPLLASDAVAKRARMTGFAPAGSHAIKGLKEPLAVHARTPAGS